METVSIKIEDGFARELEKAMKRHRYVTKTEFIREAMRDKMNALEKLEAIERLELIRGTSKTKTTDEQRHRAGEEAFEEIARLLR